ncbi:uncharacterized protein LOC739572 [Pan troglodytes]|uniref:uncharacterized protein LOC739572 n=1 Tax=Pan troglodytes TaxID=9598 RepID=UPI00301347B1
MDRPRGARDAGGARSPPFLPATSLASASPAGAPGLQLRSPLLQLRVASGNLLLRARSRRLERPQSALQLGCFSRAPCDGRIRSQAPPYVILPSFSSVWRLGSLPPRRHLEGGMASTLMGNEGEKKSSWPSQAAPSLRGGPASLSRSEEYLSRISTELMEEALCTACCHLNPVPIKKKQSQDQATQISKRETVPAARHTSCQLLVKRTCLKTTLLPLVNHFRLWGPPGHEQQHPEAFKVFWIHHRTLQPQPARIPPGMKVL